MVSVGPYRRSSNTRYRRSKPNSSNIKNTVSAIFGGLASVATGGSFENGAFQAAMVHLFNNEADKINTILKINKYVKNLQTTYQSVRNAENIDKLLEVAVDDLTIFEFKIEILSKYE